MYNMYKLSFINRNLNEWNRMNFFNSQSKTFDYSICLYTMLRPWYTISSRSKWKKMEKVSNNVLTFKRILRAWRTWKLKSFMWKSGPASCKLQVAHFISYKRISSLLLQFYTRIYEHVRWKWIVSQLLRKLLYPFAFLGWILTRL